jgi:hypothetical protein
MKKKIIMISFIYFVSNTNLVSAQQHSYSGVTAENLAEEQEACSSDALRYCGGFQTSIFEMESCLSKHVNQLTSECRDEIAPTDFKKYYSEEQHIFD